MKRWLLFIVCFFPVFFIGRDLQGQGLSWQIKNHEDPAQFYKQINSMTDQGYVPVGLSQQDGGIQVLYIKTDTLVINGCRFVSYENREALVSGITAVMKDGYIPSGISYTGKHILVIYIKTPNSATAWRLTSCEADADAVMGAMEEYTREGYFPVGITAFSSKYYILLIKTQKSKIESWLIRTNELDGEELETDVNKLIGRGFLPWGLLLRDRRVHVLYAGLVPFKMID